MISANENRFKSSVDYPEWQSVHSRPAQSEKEKKNNIIEVLCPVHLRLAQSEKKRENFYYWSIMSSSFKASTVWKRENFDQWSMISSSSKQE